MEIAYTTETYIYGNGEKKNTGITNCPYIKDAVVGCFSCVFCEYHVNKNEEKKTVECSFYH